MYCFNFVVFVIFFNFLKINVPFGLGARSEITSLQKHLLVCRMQSFTGVISLFVPSAF